MHRSRQKDDAPGTLGDLLYADRAAAPIPEEEWVRLVQSIAAGDQAALRSLYARAHRLVFTLAMRISGSRENAEEITIDVFHEIWRRSAQYDAKGGSVVGWIMNQARSRSIDRLRFEQRQKRAPRDGARADEQAIEAPADEADAQRRRSLLAQALVTLSPDEREAIETAYFSQRTYAETATSLGQPLGTIKTRIRSALAKLREAIKREQGEP